MSKPTNTYNSPNSTDSTESQDIKNDQESSAYTSTYTPSNPSNPSKLELLEIAKKWHLRICQELETPILPHDLDPVILNRKIKEISRQREKHKIYYRVLGKLIINNKHKET